MKTWFTSLNGAITLSAIALLVFMGRTFVDFQFVFNSFAATPGMAALTTVVYMALFGGWLWGLLAAVHGSRRGLIAALVFGLLLPVLTGIGTLLAFCPSPCRTAGGLMEIANWLNLVTGAIAAVAIGLHL